MTLIDLNYCQAREAGHDTCEMLDFPIRRASLGRCIIDYEEGPSQVWVLKLHTDSAHRRLGEATRMLQAFADHFRAKTIFWGTIGMREVWLKPLLSRLGGTWFSLPPDVLNLNQQERRK